jgi:acyl-coenzyme A synthetase/AMP-(fatty) acid ligase
MLPSTFEHGRLQSLIEIFTPNYVFAPSEALRAFGFDEKHTSGEYGFAEISEVSVDMHPDLLLLMTTSGSTGSPMLVRISSDNAYHNAKSIIESLNLTSTDRALTTLPMNYTYGLSIINSQLEAGGSLVVSEASLMDRQFWNLVADSGSTYFGGVPYTYQMLQRVGVKRLSGTSLRMLTQAGGKLDEDTVRKIHSDCVAIGIEFNVMYGQTEATARISVLESRYVADHPWSIGHVIPGGTLRIVDVDSRREVPQGVVGELEYSGPNVAMGYATRKTDLSLSSEFGGSIYTGDLAVLEPDGFLRIVGRRKRFVKIFGNRVNLDDVEIMVTDNGLEAACTGVDDKLTVHVVPDGNASLFELQDLVAKFIGAHKNSVEVRYIPNIPRAASGKVLYSALVEARID